MDEQRNDGGQAGACEGLSDKESGHRVWMCRLGIQVGKHIYMEHRKTFRETSLCM